MFKSVIHGRNVDRWPAILDSIFKWNKNCKLSLCFFDSEDKKSSSLSHFMLLHPFVLEFVDDGRNPQLTKYFSVTPHFLSTLDSEKSKMISIIKPEENYIALFWYPHRKPIEYVQVYFKKLSDWGVSVLKRIVVIDVYCNPLENTNLIWMLETRGADYIVNTDFSKFTCKKPKILYFLKKEH